MVTIVGVDVGPFVGVAVPNGAIVAGGVNVNIYSARVVAMAVSIVKSV